MSYDCIVVGAGPAGSTTAYRLARDGLSVLLLEKEATPRYKACGGGVTARTMDWLDLRLPDHAEDHLLRAVFTFRGKLPITVDLDAPAVYFVRRDTFDLALARQAAQAGVDLRDRTPVLEVRPPADEKEPFVVVTPAGAFAGRFLVGADGANTLVGRTLGLLPREAPARRLDCGSALEAELPLEADSPPGRHPSPWSNTAVIDFGPVNRGYGWIFSKGRRVSAGVAMLAPRAASLRRPLDEFLRAYGLAGIRPALGPRGHLLPRGGKPRRLDAGRALLVGDAARLVDPFTGEGIYYAVKSGALAAAVIAGCRRGDNRSLADYTTVVEREVLPELREAQAVGDLFYPFARAWHQLLRLQPAPLRYLLKAVRGGSDTYSLRGILREFLAKSVQG